VILSKLYPLLKFILWQEISYLPFIGGIALIIAFQNSAENGLKFFLVVYFFMQFIIFFINRKIIISYIKFARGRY